MAITAWYQTDTGTSIDRPERAGSIPRDASARSVNAEIADHDRAITTLSCEAAPLLLAETGIGRVTAATFVLSWSHHGRCRSEAVFARLVGAAPVPATDPDRHRLNRGGDRRLNQDDPTTCDYVARRAAEGTTQRETVRHLERYIARRVRHLLEHAPPREPTHDPSGSARKARSAWPLSPGTVRRLHGICGEP